MKLVKKQALLVTLLASMAGILAGCNKDNRIHVTWWNNYQVPENMTEEDSRKKSTYTEYWFATDLIKAFEEENPTIKIDMSYKGNYSAIVTATSSALGTGDQPNIVSCYGDSVAVFRNASEEAVLDMSEYAKELTSDSDFNQSYLSIEKGMYGDKFYSLPYSKSGEVLVVNQSMFDLDGAGKAGEDTSAYKAPVAADTKKAYKIPENIDDLMSLARTIKADFPELYADQKDEKGYFKAVPFCWDSAENMFISALKNSGIDYTDGTKGTAAARVLFNNQKAKDLMVQIKKWNNEGLFCTQSQLPITDEANQYHDYSSNMLVKGSIAMCLSSTAGARYFATDGGFKASFNHPVSWKENGKAEDAYVISQGPSLCFFDKGQESNDAAFTFYKYLTNATNSGKLAAATSYFPLREKGYENTTIAAAVDAATKGVDASASYNDKKTAYTGGVLALNKTCNAKSNYFLSPVFKESSATRTAVGKLVAEVLDNKDAQTDDQIKAAVDTAFTNAYTAIMA